jgi:sugar/nucleoside kinase (ribokinase family)
MIEGDEGSRTVISAPHLTPTSVLVNIESLHDASFILWDGHYQNVFGAVSKKLTKRLPIVFDSGRWKPGLHEWLDRFDTAIVSSAFTFPNSHASNAIDDLAKSGIRLCAQTHGPGPINWLLGERTGRIVPPTAKAVDSLGAGDVFHGAYCYYRFVKKFDDVEAMEAGANIAAKSVAFEGPRQGVHEFLLESFHSK